jgi:hypothetical protein
MEFPSNDVVFGLVDGKDCSLMQSLIFKIFLAYWLAAGVVIAISDYEPHRHIHNPELTDALDASLAMNGRALIHAYESGTCESMLSWLHTSADSLYLAQPGGRIVCGDLHERGTETLIASALKSHKRTTSNYASFQLIALPVTGSQGVQYILLVKNHYSYALQVYGLLPGYTTIAISGVVTFFLAVLVAFPIRRLRATTYQIAAG